MAVPAMDGTMAASYLTMRGQKWMIGQHDDRFYHRRRWERSESSETTSASRIEYPNRCDWRCSHDRERCIRRVRNNSVGRCHVEIFVRPMRYKGCHQAHNAQVVICALLQRVTRGFLHWRFAYAGPTVRAAPPSWGRHPQTFTTTDSYTAARRSCFRLRFRGNG